MNILFSKYQGAGNDFIMIDQRHRTYLSIDNIAIVEFLCDRHFGVGADGLILLESSDKADFKMIYFNADGEQSTMCGNGGRCIVEFAARLAIFEGNSTSFEAIDGIHHAKRRDDGRIALEMANVSKCYVENGDYLVNTGSPHYVRFADELAHKDIVPFGKSIRYNSRFRQDGINVNIATMNPNGILVSTYERGVEDMTLACGTGVTAVALAAAIAAPAKYDGTKGVLIKTAGGLLEVCYEQQGNSFENIWLIGPAEHVFDGSIHV